MGCKVLDVTGWAMVQAGGYFRFSSDSERLMTSGFVTPEALQRNRRGFRDDEGTRTLMRNRYNRFHKGR